MTQSAPIEKVFDLTDPSKNIFLNLSPEEALEFLASGDPQKIRRIEGQFALLHRQGTRIRMIRSIGRPMRYFIAKKANGPILIVSERIDQIRERLIQEGLEDQFHPSYTRMVPAHYLTEIALIGCPDPSPNYTRFFTPMRNSLPPNIEVIGGEYIQSLATSLHEWLDQIDSKEPIGVLFSGGIDSGALFLTLYDTLLKRGESPARLKAFTLDVAGSGEDSTQAEKFLSELGLSLFLEKIVVGRDEVSMRDAVRTIEDYKPLDVQAAAMGLALCRGIRARYPEWTWLLDGDGGDENLKDYPIEDNKELTIRSVLNNLMLYQEGWGVHAIKHSLTYSGGQSRGHVRSYAPAASLGFRGFSPFALPRMIEIAEGIPFIELTNWEHGRLYDLKGKIVSAGVKAVTGLTMPVYPKRRFQNGASDTELFQEKFPRESLPYRECFLEQYAKP